MEHSELLSDLISIHGDTGPVRARVNNLGLTFLMCSCRERFFSAQWATAIKTRERSLGPDDLETVARFQSWDNFENHFAGGDSGVALIWPSLGHLRSFSEIFQTKLAGRPLDTSFFWGILGCLLKVGTDRSFRPDKLSLSRELEL